MSDVGSDATPTKIRKPCSSCPWRIDAKREHWDPLHFKEIWQSCQDDGFAQMQCHKTTKAKPLICQGWIRVMGFNAIGVRLAHMFERVTIEEIEDRSGPELFASFVEMLRANKIKIPKRNRWDPPR